MSRSIHPDYDRYRATQARAQEAIVAVPDDRGTYGIDYFFDSDSPEYSGLKEKP